MERDYIDVVKSDGSIEKMELVVAFTLDSKNCIIYKSTDGKETYYAASYTDDDYKNLNTNFTNEEKEKIRKIFNKLNLGGKLNE
ncbi:MAG TPA: hypothetical protein PLC53_00660 [Bacilli bacterium]|nr:hypothetical protein [Bacilli bacterium]